MFGMVERREQARLLEQVVGVAGLAVGDLDRDLLVDPGVAREEDRAEAAGAEVGEDLVFPDRLAEQEHGARAV